MDSAKQQLVEKLNTANNVLVTVSQNPSVDQLAALLGLALLMNKQGKHCAAVFSGQIPSTIEFLKPEEMIETTTDSLRDFIIALDKSKADKLRYKVEDNVVRIFITPYRSSISQDDLEFTQGDFNVDVVIGLGVVSQEDLDQAITSHGRILHDAVLATVNVASEGGLGSINWYEPGASSLSELIAELAQALGDNLLDEQIATALLTGIVAETERFSNDKTSSQTMSMSSVLMAAGANQQLIATKLEEQENQPNVKLSDGTDANGTDVQNDDGTLQINHTEEQEPKQGEKPEDDDIELPEPSPEVVDTPEAPEPADQSGPPAGFSNGPKLVTEPPSLGGTLTANSSQNDIEPITDPFSMPQVESPKMLNHKPENVLPTDTPSAANVETPDIPIPTPPSPALPAVDSFTPPPPTWTSPPEPDASDSESSDQEEEIETSELHIDEDGTLTQLEEAVHSPHLENEEKNNTNADSARAEVDKALNATSATDPQPPLDSLNAQPLGPELHDDQSADKGGLPDAPPVPPPIPVELQNPPSQQQ